MSVQKHTPGPWSVSTGRANIGGHGHTCWLVGQEFGSVGCAVVILPDEDDTPEARIEREATANLVASAPNLLAALESVEWSYRYGGGDRCPMCCNFLPEGHAPDCLIGNAIKKARGEA